MQKNIFILIALFIIMSCGVQHQLLKSYKGKPVSDVAEEFGAPKSIIEKEGAKIYIFELREKLKSTEINQGKLTLDPIVTPKVKKTERYYFTVVNGVVSSVKYEEEYER